jgi:hypothetical protein
VRPSSEWIVVERAHPEIVTLEEAEAIQRVNEELAAASRVRGSQQRMREVRTRASRYLLSGGLFTCDCGAAMIGYAVVNGAAGRRRRRTYYRCSARTYRRESGGCVALNVRKDELEGRVLDAIAGLLDAALREEGDASKLRVLTRRSCEDELAKVRRERDNIRRAIRSGLCQDMDWVNAELRKLAKREKALTAQATEEDSGIVNIDRGRVRQWLSALPRIRVSEDFAEARVFIRQFVQSIRLDSSARTITVSLALPFEGAPTLELPLQVGPTGDIGQGTLALPMTGGDGLGD